MRESLDAIIKLACELLSKNIVKAYVNRNNVKSRKLLAYQGFEVVEESMNSDIDVEIAFIKKL